MKDARRGRRSGRPPIGRRRRTALSSVYGFIMIYLLVIASLQAISLSVSSSQAEAAAAQRAGQVAQMRSLERLKVEMTGENVTITNDGLIPSQLSFILLQGPTGSRELPLNESLAVGSSVIVGTESAAPPPSSVAVVTSLGDVFESSPAGSPPPGEGMKTLGAAVGGPDIDAQLYQNPGDPGRFFVAVGPSVYAYSSTSGARLWSFDASQGVVTAVLPLSDGGVYVSDGYYGDQFTSNLFRLSSSGTSVFTYTMRLFRLYTTLEIQYPDGDQPPYPVGSQPVEKGLDALYAYYDGWFFSSSGLSPTVVPADTFNLAGSDGSQFYLYTTSANPGGFGCTDPRGNVLSIYAYSAATQGVQQQWSTLLYLNACDEYPNQLISSSSGSGLFVSLYSETYWTQPTYFGGPYPGSNPFLAVLSASSGEVLRSGSLDSNGYSSVATDGTNVYLSIPSSDEIEMLSASGSGDGTFYDVGFPASTLAWDDGSLFAISDTQVRVYGPSMTLEKTIDFSPLAFYSLSDSKPLETEMIQPSFLVLNSTSYLALLRNSTGYGSLVLGSYSP